MSEVPHEKQVFPRWYADLEVAALRVDLAAEGTYLAHGGLQELPPQVAVDLREATDNAAKILYDAKVRLRRLAVHVRMNVASGKDPLEGVGA